jgi:L-2-hydroxyglutarate oxidase LhgO
MAEPTDHIEAVVIGAGVIGLATARALALAGREVIILEENLAIGEETSARNNEVIHAGFLYPPDSLKARLCKPGRDMLYTYAAGRGIGHRKFPKLMPAITADDIPLLETYLEQGHAAGVDDLQMLSATEVAKLEPGLRCNAALLSSSTGIVDSHGLMLALQGDAEDRGAAIAFGTQVVGGEIVQGRILVEAKSQAGTTRLSCDVLVNAAGLGAEKIARSLAGFPAGRVPKVYFAKGEFYSLSGKPPFSHLVVPPPALLAQGGSLTIDMGGQGKFGPDLSFVERRDYAVAPDAAEKFADAARTYWTNADASRLLPGYAGIRPRVTGPGLPPGDWMIEGPADHGVAGLVHLFGMDTPGLTSCLAIAGHVLEKLDIRQAS